MRSTPGTTGMGDDHPNTLAYIRTVEGFRDRDLDTIFHYRGGRQTERWFYPDDVAAWSSVFGG